LDQTILDIAIIAGGIIGYFISISLVTTSFYKSRANKHLSLSLFLLTTLTFLDWYEPQHDILDILGNFELEFLVAVTLFTYFLI